MVHFDTVRSTFNQWMFSNVGPEGEVSRHSRAAGWLAQVGGQNPGHYRQKRGMGHLEQQTSRLQLGG